MEEQDGFLVVNCKTCGQPRKRKIIRLNEADFKAWEAAIYEERSSWPGTFRGLKAMAAVVVVFGALSGTAGRVYPEEWLGPAGFIAFFVILLTSVIHHCSAQAREWRRAKEQQAKILTSYGITSPDDVGDAYDDQRKFVILPQK